MLVPSLLKARPALKARTISDSRMAIAELWLVCGVALVNRRTLDERDRLVDASVITSKSALIKLGLEPLSTYCYCHNAI